VCVARSRVGIPLRAAADGYMQGSPCRRRLALLQVESDLTHTSAMSPSQTGSSHTSTHSQRNLAPLDWIPPDDLVILCLPPRLDSRFPATHSITLAGRPHVGFSVPFGLLECVDILVAPPLLLRELVCSKLPWTYLLSGL
jgi:hypothetical protein